MHDSCRKIQGQYVSHSACQLMEFASFGMHSHLYRPSLTEGSALQLRKLLCALQVGGILAGGITVRGLSGEHPHTCCTLHAPRLHLHFLPDANTHL